MSQNREEILADFQACTGIEDVGEAIFHLEATEWDLLSAVNRVMPQETQHLPSEMESSTDIEMIEPALPAASASVLQYGGSSSSTAPSTRSVKSVKIGPTVTIEDRVSIPMATASTSTASDDHHLLTFQLVHGEQEFELQVPDTGTLGYLKSLVEAKVKVPACRLELEGWRRNPGGDMTVLHTLHLPRKTSLLIVIKDPSPDGAMASDETKMTERLTQLFTLKVKDETQQRNYNLKFPGTHTVLQVKQDLFEVTDIPVRHQKWTGWPLAARDDSVTLACSGISYPEHSLSLCRSAVSKDNKKNQLVVDIADSDNSSVEEFEDASESFNGEDEIFDVDVQTKKIHHLMPDNVEDEVAGCIHFAEEYTNRYGDTHPLFFQGSLEEAVREACNKPARERRPLAIYLHHDGSVLTNVFCTQLLNSESVVSYLSEHYVIWGWDLTYEANKSKMLSSASQCLGPMTAHIIRNIDIDRLPAVLIANKIRSAIEIVSVMYGNMGVNELMSSLIQVRERFAENQQQEIQEEEERAAREMVKREQDLAYEESLELDRAKEEAKKAQEMAKVQEEQRIRSAQQEEAARKEARRAEAMSRLPAEPADMPGDSITRIRFRLPSGEFVNRRFLITSILQELLDFMLIQGYPSDEFKILSSWPRRDLTCVDSNQSLQQLSLCPQETVILEER